MPDVSGFSTNPSSSTKSRKEPATPVSPVRKALVADAVKKWVDELTDRTGRNQLLYYRHLKVGTIDLANADPKAVDRLLKGNSVRIAQLFNDAESISDAVKRARAVEAKARSNDEERGIQTLYLAFGMASWTTPSDKNGPQPNAPVLLFPVTIKSQGYTALDFDLAINDLPELNPVLLQILEIDVDEEHILGDDFLSRAQLEVAMSKFSEVCKDVPGFIIKEGSIIGNFSYAKLPMVKDIQANIEEIEHDTLLSAIAGDQEARQELREHQSALNLENIIPVPPPQNEFLILEADSSQSWAIAAAKSGANLVIEGPPGTGKSQTIANLIAASVAEGKSVLFVAEKRAAIDAVLTRLNDAGLERLILDLHSGNSDRHRVGAEIATSLTEAQNTLKPNVQTIHKNLTRHRSKLDQYEMQLHQQIEPWKLAAFEVQVRLHELSEVPDLGIRFDRNSLNRVPQASLELAMEELSAFIALGGLEFTGDNSYLFTSMFTSRLLSNRSDLEAAINSLGRTRSALSNVSESFDKTCTQLGITQPRSISEAFYVIKLLTDLLEVEAEARFELFQADLPKLLSDLAPARGWTRLVSSLFSSKYRAALKDIREYTNKSNRDDKYLLHLVEKAASVCDRWKLIAIDGARPAAWSTVSEFEEITIEISNAIAHLNDSFGVGTTENSDFGELESLTALLDSRRSFLLHYPDLDAHYRFLVDLGLESVVPAVGKLNLNEDTAAKSLEQCWLLSILQLLWIDLPSLSTFSPDTQDSTVNQFQISDIDHIKTGAQRVKRIWASNSVDVRNNNQYEADILASQASLGAKSRKHMPVRRLFQAAKEVLIAVKPCWVMSPLLVAQVLPGEKCFDLVVFDEASQIPPADAVSTLLRGRQTIVAGDPYQLPPTPFFASGSVINAHGDEEDEDDEQEEEGDDETQEEQVSKENLAVQRTQVKQGQAIALVEGQESLLDLMKALLPPPHGTKMLNWHYRSRCEALIAFSNAQDFLYDWRLATFPSTGTVNCINFVLAPFTAGSEEASASAGPEVSTVVALAIEHAEQFPDQTLGIIALGSKHANRIRGVLQAALESRNDIAGFFEESGTEGFFIKNLETVQGDERDAIILSTGYSRRKDGGMRYNFGPINQAHGHRRLNVAITRAKIKLTLVSSFSSADMDDERLTSLGPRMLKNYLAYAESGGTDLGRQVKVKPEMNAFERDVYEALQNQGLKLIPQFGDSGYWIDFAVMHPDLPGKPILAIETDGAMYHSSPTARDRDRLRQKQLEARGWRFHRIWSTAWFRNKEEEITKVVQVYKELLDNPPDSPVAEKALPQSEEAPDILQAPVREAPPRVRRGLSIGNYTQSTLVSIIVWIHSDGRLRTDDEMLSEAITFLGFKKRGTKIVAAINSAIKRNKLNPEK